MAFVSQIKKLQMMGISPSSVLFPLGFTQIQDYKKYLQQIDRIRSEARANKLSEADANELVAAYTSGGRSNFEYQALGLIEKQQQVLRLSSLVNEFFEQIEHTDEHETKEFIANLKENLQKIEVAVSAQKEVAQEFATQQQEVLEEAAKKPADPNKPIDLIKEKELDANIPTPEIKTDATAESIVPTPIEEETEPAKTIAPTAPSPASFDPSNNEKFAKLESLIAEHKQMQAEITALKSLVENGFPTEAQVERLEKLQSQTSGFNDSFANAKKDFEAVHQAVREGIEGAAELSPEQKRAYLDKINDALEYASNPDAAAKLGAGNMYSNAADNAKLASAPLAQVDGDPTSSSISDSDPTNAMGNSPSPFNSSIRKLSMDDLEVDLDPSSSSRVYQNTISPSSSGTGVASVNIEDPGLVVN